MSEWRLYEKRCGFSELEGKTIERVVGLKKDSERVEIRTSDGAEYVMWHMQDCCERVAIEDVAGSVDAIVGSPILRASEDSDADGEQPHNWSESYTWTFYTLATAKGTVVIRWLGESNGYYSESVEFACLRSPSAAS